MSKDGITALQMDVKTLDLTPKILEKALKQAHEGRMFILGEMIKALPASRAKVSKFAPKIKLLHIPVDKIGEVIGPGGRIIKQIISETGAAVDVEDDGTVSVSAPDEKAVDKRLTGLRV